MLFRTRVESYIKSRITQAASSPLLAFLIPFLPYLPDADSYCIEHPHPDTPRAEDGFAVPPPQLWLGYARDPESYLDSGRRHTDAMLALLAAHGGALDAESRVLDFGCGAGRMIRRLAQVQPAAELWGTDIRADHVIWCQQYLSPPAHFLTSTTVPHLPFADSYFDLIYAGSVFSHLDDLADAWLMELRRILRPGGRLYITIQDRYTIETLNSERWRNYWLSRFLRAHRHYERYTAASFRKFTIGRALKSYVFYDTEHFCTMLEPFFKTLTVNRQAYTFQTVLLFQKAGA